MVLLIQGLNLSSLFLAIIESGKGQRTGCTAALMDDSLGMSVCHLIMHEQSLVFMVPV